MQATRKINITVIKANLTKDVCIFSTMSPYFIAKLTDEKIFTSKKKTNEGKFPIFNESFSFTYSEEEILFINIYHSNRHIGGCEIDLLDMKQGGVMKNACTLKNEQSENGVIKVFLQIDKEPDLEADCLEDHIDYSKNIFVERAGLRFMTQRIHEKFDFSDQNSLQCSAKEIKEISPNTNPIYTANKENDLNLINIKKRVFSYDNKVYQL